MSPKRIHLKRDERLTIEWDDGATSAIDVVTLRRLCPCASCKALRAQLATNRLTIVPTSATGDAPVTVERLERVGNYAVRPTWSDGHATGIYAWDYLRFLGDGGEPSSAETWPKH